MPRYPWGRWAEDGRRRKLQAAVVAADCGLGRAAVAPGAESCGQGRAMAGKVARGQQVEGSDPAGE